MGRESGDFKKAVCLGRELRQRDDEDRSRERSEREHADMMR
jgi:hypothetical protein